MTEAAQRSVRALSFGAIADDYDRCRPGPLGQAVDWLVPVAADVAVDLAAGTGRLSERLAGSASRVVAVEPDRRMLAVLGRRRPDVPRVAGRAEALPLRRAGADFVGVASAWHWMEHGAALREIARVLRPGGVLGVLWSGPDRSVPWVGGILGPAGSAAPDAERVRRRRLDVADDGPFEPPESALFRGSIDYPVADLVGLAASFSSLITLPPGERRRALDAVAERIATVPELAGRDRVDLPLRAIAWRARRRPD